MALPEAVLRVLVFLLLVIPTLSAQGFVDVTTQTGLSIPTNNFHFLGRGPCFADFDGDGDLDFVMPLGFSPTGANNIRYYTNNGNGTFTDQTLFSGLVTSGAAHAAMAADIDNDGDLDLFIAHDLSPNQLWINQGNGTFVNEGGIRGVDVTTGSFTASFGDYDRDGWIDLYVGTWQGFNGPLESNLLFRNTGNGFFQDVTATAGVGNMGLTFAGVFHDYNDDGWPDIFVGNDRGFVPGVPPDTTYLNNGDGTFTDVGAAVGTLVGIGAMGADFADAWNDGGWDIVVSNTSQGHIFHRWDPVTASYTDVAATVGVVTNIEGWAVNFLDYDNDGLQDIYFVHAQQPNALYKNTGWPGPWINMAPALGADVPGAKYTSAIVDYDNDGRLDIFVPRSSGPAGTVSVFLKNNVAAGNYLRVRTVGTVSNRDGIGAKLVAHVGANTYRRQIKSGVGYLGHSDLRAHFGLGTANQVDHLEILWPSGQVQDFFNLSVNQEITAMEPRLTLTGTPVAGATLSLEHLSPNDPNLFSVVYLSTATSPGIPLGDGRVVPGNLDALAQITLLAPGNPLLPSPMGFLNGLGSRSMSLQIPAVASLSGFSFFATGVTVDSSIPQPYAPVRNILLPLPITIQ